MDRAVRKTVAYIKILAQDMAGFDPDTVILTILFDLKLPVDHHGFGYLRTAVLLQYRNPRLLTANEIYQIIAQQWGDVSAEAVATNIRRAIHITWDQEGMGHWKIYLPWAKVTREHIPTNAEVIAGLARILELWQGCADAYLRQHCKEVVCCERN